MEDSLTTFIVLSWIASAILGAIVGAQKKEGAQGFVLGLIFGPLGLIASFALDGRLECYRCHSRVNGEPQVCPYCRAELGWAYDRFYDLHSMPPEKAAEINAKQQEERPPMYRAGEIIRKTVAPRSAPKPPPPPVDRR